MMTGDREGAETIPEHIQLNYCRAIADQILDLVKLDGFKGVKFVVALTQLIDKGVVWCGIGDEATFLYLNFLPQTLHFSLHCLWDLAFGVEVAGGEEFNQVAGFAAFDVFYRLGVVF